MPFRSLVRLLTLIAGCALMNACAPTPTPAAASNRSAPLNPPVKVLIADNQTTGAAPIDIALDKGYYKEEGPRVVDLDKTPPRWTLS